MNGYTTKKQFAKYSNWIHRSRLHHLVAPLFGGLGHILMFHRVVEDLGSNRIHNHLSLEISRTHFKETIQYFRDRNYAFISMDMLHQVLSEKKRLNQRFVIFTFDDGYLDNFEIAYPICRDLNIPMTIYITNCFPNMTKSMWWYHLERLVLEKDEIEILLDDKVYRFECHTVDQKESAFDQLRTLLIRHIDNEHEEEILKSFFGNWRDANEKMIKNEVMDWDILSEIDKDPLVTIGGHTMNHLALSQLSEEEMVREIDSSRDELESKLRNTISHFAYPFGKKSEADSRESIAVQKLGFKTAVTTRIGNIFSEHCSHLTTLPRININAYARPKVLDLQTAGMIQMIKHKGKRVVTL